MKKTYVLLVVWLFSCSAPKYSYYFDHVQPGSKSAKTEPTSALDPIDPVSVAASAEVSPALTSPSKPGNVHTADVSTSAVQPYLSHSDGAAASKTATFHAKKSSKKAVAGDSNSGMAIAGFVTSIVGFLVYWPLCILGIIFSAIGLRSNRRGLAIAGLVIGIVGAAIVIIGGASGAIQ